MKARSGATLVASIRPAASLSEGERGRLLALMRVYYDGVTAGDFARDLATKHAVILLRHPHSREILGFSTLRRLVVPMADGRRARGVFSGDTIVDRRYWGQKVLGRAFLRFMLLERVRHPWTPLYWFLMSKGYKTYLLMANNFAEHWPRFEAPMPYAASALRDAAYGALFGARYDAASGRVDVDAAACRLKDGVATPSTQLMAANPRVRFFAAANPAWHEGVELCCVARMSVLLPLRYAAKAMDFSRLMDAWRRPAGASRDVVAASGVQT